jgi:hypothetical protein
MAGGAHQGLALRIRFASSSWPCASKPSSDYSNSAALVLTELEFCGTAKDARTKRNDRRQ